MALWSGRFTEGVSEFTQQFGASLPVDKALYAQDIAGSKAHARMLAAQGVISQDDCDAIQAGLDAIKARIEAGEFAFDINDEDIHMSIESVLTAEIGDAGARLHTGRSRNDQVATDTRLYAKERCRQLMADNLALLIRGGLAWNENGGDADVYSLGVGTRYYFSKVGVFVGANVNVDRWDWGEYDDTKFSLGLEAGYAFFLSKTVTLEPAAYWNVNGDRSKFGLKLGFGLYF